MKKHPIKYIKSYGFKLFLIQTIILILNKAKMLKKIKDRLILKKNDMIFKRLSKDYHVLTQNYKNKEFNDKNNSNKIWILWWQGEENMPELVKICLENMKKKLYDSEVIVLSKNNINNYIQIPEFILKKFNNGIIGFAHFSDILRIALLKEYGGIWIDSTIYISKELSQKQISKIKTIKFKCKEKTSIPKGQWCCFFLGKLNTKLYHYMYDFYLKYWSKEDIIIDYFLMDFIVKIAYQNFPEVKKDIDNNEYNNEQIHKLASLLNNKFNQDEYETLLENNFIHKLSYKIKLQEKINNQPTYWGIIKNGGYDEK